MSDFPCSYSYSYKDTFQTFHEPYCYLSCHISCHTFHAFHPPTLPVTIVSSPVRVTLRCWSSLTQSISHIARTFSLCLPSPFPSPPLPLLPLSLIFNLLFTYVRLTHWVQCMSISSAIFIICGEERRFKSNPSYTTAVLGMGIRVRKFWAGEV